MKVTATELANMRQILSDLWDRKVTSSTYEEWRNKNGAIILDAHLTVEVMLKRVKSLEVEVVE